MSSNPFHSLRACFEACFGTYRPRNAPRPSTSSPARRSNNCKARLSAKLANREHLERPAHTARNVNNVANGPRPLHKSQRAAGLTATAAHNHTQPLPHPKPQGTGQSAPPIKPGADPWSTTLMNRDELRELFNIVHKTLEHVPYAICSLGALIDHGLTEKKTYRISIICPQESRNNIKAWAVARGFYAAGDSIGLPTVGGVRRVRVKYVSHGFYGLQFVRSSFSNARVLSVASQLDNVAASYLENRKRGDEQSMRGAAEDILFILDRLAARHERLNSRFLSTFLGEDFFVDFTTRYASARPDMARAGIDVSAVLAGHRDAAALREHDQLLQQYGMRGDVVSSRKSQFGHVGQGPNSRQRGYAMGERASLVEPVVPSMPQFPKAAYKPANINSSRPLPDRGNHQKKPEQNVLRKPPVRVAGVTDPGRSLTTPRQTSRIPRKPAAPRPSHSKPRQATIKH